MNNIFGPNRQSIRLNNYDYAAEGLYYVTLCTKNRQLLFGDIKNGEMYRSTIGVMVQKAWEELPRYDRRISLDEFQIMPDHFHGIIVIGDDSSQRLLECFGGRNPNGGRGWDPAPTMSLSDVIHRFKSWTTHHYNIMIKHDGVLVPRIPLWERNYYEHIVRNDEDLYRIRQYIQDNPKNWDENRP